MLSVPWPMGSKISISLRKIGRESARVVRPIGEQLYWGLCRLATDALPPPCSPLARIPDHSSQPISEGVLSRFSPLGYTTRASLVNERTATAGGIGQQRTSRSSRYPQTTVWADGLAGWL